MVALLRGHVLTITLLQVRRDQGDCFFTVSHFKVAFEGTVMDVAFKTEQIRPWQMGKERLQADWKRIQ